MKDKVIQKLKGINIGIVAESDEDISICIAYCNRILRTIDLFVQVYKGNRCVRGTQIRSTDAVFINNFFEKSKSQKPRFLLIFTDRDSEKNRRKDLSSIENNLHYKCLLVIPEERVEDWLINDLGPINKVLKLRLSAVPVKNRKFDSKSWFLDIIGQSAQGLDYSQVCKKIVGESDISKIKNGFKEFSEDLKRMTQPKKAIFLKNKKTKKMRKEVLRKFNAIRKIHPKSSKDRRRE